jgi:hypothetical protein
MCPRIDGEYSGSSSVGSQPNSHVVSPLQPRRPLRFSTLLALDVRRPRGEVHRIPAAPPRADRYRRSPLSLFCSGLPSPPRPASAMGFRASRASPAGIAVELKSPGASGSAATGQCPNRTPAIGTAMAPGSKNFGPQNCGAVPRTSVQDQGAARMIEDYYDFPTGSDF